MSLSKRNILVTAIVTTYNRSQLVRRAVRSVLAQTYQPLEILVVEDGSNSNIEAWLHESRLGHARYICHAENKGLAAARNTGLGLANGEYIAYLDDDNEWKPERIARQMELLNQLTPAVKERLGVIHCGLETRYPGHARVAIAPPRNVGNLREAIIREGARTLASTCLFPKAVLEEVGGFDESLPSSVDHDIWMALASAGYEARAVDEPLVINYHRPSHSAMTGRTIPRIQGVRMYVEKWEPTFQEWLGEAEGTAYCHRYFARVIASLAASKLVDGDLSEARYAIHEIFCYSRETKYNVFVLLNRVALAGARCYLPQKVIDLLKTVKHATNPKVRLLGP